MLDEAFGDSSLVVEMSKVGILTRRRNGLIGIR